MQSRMNIIEETPIKPTLNIILDDIEEIKGYNDSIEIDTKYKHNNYCFTINNYSSEQIHELARLAECNSFVFICWGYEIGENGTPHLQGYVEFKESVSIQTILRKYWGFHRAWLGPRSKKSNKLYAVTYCAKELIKKVHLPIYKKNFDDNKDTAKIWKNPTEMDILNFGRFNIKEWRDTIFIAYQNQYFEAGSWEHGLRPGTRTDINVIKELISRGGNMNDVIDHANSYQAMKCGELILKYKEPTRNWKSHVVWITGPSGSGKSHLAMQMCGYNRKWISKKSLDWFDGYTGQNYVIFDDIKENHLGDYSWFLRLTDKYPLSVDVKGTFTDWKPKFIIITSIFTPEELFHERANAGGTSKDSASQGLRRIDKKVVLNRVYTGPKEEITDTDILKGLSEIDIILSGLNIESTIEIGNSGQADISTVDSIITENEVAEHSRKQRDFLMSATRRK